MRPLRRKPSENGSLREASQIRTKIALYNDSKTECPLKGRLKKYTKNPQIME